MLGKGQWDMLSSIHTTDSLRREETLKPPVFEALPALPCSLGTENEK